MANNHLLLRTAAHFSSKTFQPAAEERIGGWSGDIMCTFLTWANNKSYDASPGMEVKHIFGLVMTVYSRSHRITLE